jgi:hypothetical protein
MEKVLSTLAPRKRTTHNHLFEMIAEPNRPLRTRFIRLQTGSVDDKPLSFCWSDSITANVRLSDNKRSPWHASSMKDKSHRMRLNKLFEHSTGGSDAFILATFRQTISEMSPCRRISNSSPTHRRTFLYRRFWHKQGNGAGGRRATGAQNRTQTTSGKSHCTFRNTSTARNWTKTSLAQRRRSCPRWCMCQVQRRQIAPF